MDYYDITNNAIATGTTQPIGIKKVKSGKTRKTKSYGAAFVSKLREEIETEVRAEYESHLSETLKEQSPTPPPVLPREEYIAQQLKIIRKQYKHMLCIVEKYPELSEIFVDMPLAKRIYEG